MKIAVAGAHFVGLSDTSLLNRWSDEPIDGVDRVYIHDLFCGD